MKYKLSCTDVDWLPRDCSGIKLWREDSEGRCLWPRREPLPVTHRVMRGVEDIAKGLSGFINYWEIMSEETEVESIEDVTNTWFSTGGE
jgi:hypothetical protein